MLKRWAKEAAQRRIDEFLGLFGFVNGFLRQQPIFLRLVHFWDILIGRVQATSRHRQFRPETLQKPETFLKS